MVADTIADDESITNNFITYVFISYRVILYFGVKKDEAYSSLFCR